MLFNSPAFIFLFLPMTWVIYFFLTQRKLLMLSKFFLLAASLFFYAWWNIRYLPLMIMSIAINYAIADYLMHTRSREHTLNIRKLFFVIGLAFNIGLLGFYKYTDFMISNVNFAFGQTFQPLHLMLPLAISFFTIVQIAYLVDMYEGLAYEKRFVDYALFVTYFPHLIAGPIVHHKDLIPQFNKKRNAFVNWENISKGLLIFIIGLFKKVVIADTFALWANAGFTSGAMPGLTGAWLTALSYTFQLYFDFSGYSDMAIGGSLLFNIRLPINFNSPLSARNIIDFWNRWHITLSRFITTYIYSPIVRSMKTLNFGMLMLGILITMTISGIWHGSAWTFIVWGVVHGAALVINHTWHRQKKIKLPAGVDWLLTFLFVTAAFVIFRAPTLSVAGHILGGMVGFNGLGGFGAAPMAAVSAGILVILFAKNTQAIAETFRPTWTYAFTLGLTFIIALVLMNGESEFLYFRF